MTQSVVVGAVQTGSGLQVRQDFNTSDQCIATENSGSSAPTVTYPFMHWRRTTDNNLYRRNSSNSGWEIVEYHSSVNPGTGDDSADGFVMRSLWINTSSKKLFWCLDPTAGSAVWAELTIGGGGGGGSVSSVFGRTGAVTATSGDYTADKITETSGIKMMTAAERTKLTNINSYWTARTATDPAAVVKNVNLGAHDMRRFLIFYGVPYNINGINNSDYAAGVLARYDDVVLGYGKQDPNDSNYSTTASIISKAKTLNPNLIVWGNIDCGVSGGASRNLSTSTLSTNITQWTTAGANGIFCDNFGYDFGVSRARQNTIIDAIHTAGVGAMLFATTITDALSASVQSTYNPSGTATHADSRDAYCQQFSFNSDTIASPYFDALSSVISRGDAMRTWRTSTSVRMYAINVLLWTGQGQTTLDNYYGISEALAHIFRLDGAGVMMSNFAASGSDVNKAQPYYPKILPQPGARKTAVYKSSSVELEASDIGVVVHYESGNYSWSAPGFAASVGGGGGGTAPADSGLIPTSVQTANGTAPNAERVMVKGSCSSVSLLTAASGRHAQMFMNQTTHNVTFTSSEAGGIYGYSSGYIASPFSSVMFVRDPDNNQWMAPSN